MVQSALPKLMARVLSYFYRSAVSQVLMLVTLGALAGCGNSNAKQQQDGPTSDPVAEFEWGMKRLDHVLRVSKPNSSDGLHVLGRDLHHSWTPPSGENSSYTARVEVRTRTTFLHGKRSLKKEEEDQKAEQKKKPEIDDPLAPKNDELAELIDIPGVGPKAPPAAAVIEPREVEDISVFELIYVDGRWQLTKQPELEHEQLWFKYAFD